MGVIRNAPVTPAFHGYAVTFCGQAAAAFAPLAAGFRPHGQPPQTQTSIVTK